MANKNKSGNPLRILWIPGKKKHHDKGRYNATNKSPQQSHHQKPNEMWALGGSKGHENIIKSQLDSVEESSSNMVSSMVPTALGVTSTVLGTTKLSEEDENEENRKTAAAEVNEINSMQKKKDENEIHSYADDDIKYIDSIEEHESGGSNTNNTKTLLIRDRKNGAIRKTDVDSIEKLDEVDAEPFDMPKEKLKTNDDSHHTIIYNRNRTKNGSRRKNKYKLNDEKKDKDSDSEEESKIVKCLYYGLVCCECSIS